jgi:hypothetical protein
MKNIFLKLSLVGLFAIGLTSCEEESGAVLNPDNGTNLYSFNLSNSDLAVNNTTFTDTIVIGVTSRSNVDRTINVNIDPSSDADPSYYSVPSSVVIPAGKFVGKLVVTGNADIIPEDGSESSLVFTLDDNLSFLDGKNFHVVSIYKSCAIESLAGTHRYVTTDIVSGDGSAIPQATLTGNVIFTATSNLINYTISDPSFGMYRSVYGDAPAVNPTSPAGLAWTCTGINAFGLDQYNDTLTYEVTQVNGPVLTLVWTNTYGDGATVQLTRRNGADWPAGLVTQ